MFNIVTSTNMCVVAIKELNYVPEYGLYNRARGMVVDIIYNSIMGPNNKTE